jgi:multidrug resistance efflux pump
MRAKLIEAIRQRESKMPTKVKRIAPLLVVIVLVLAAGIYFALRQAIDGASMTVSGTIEATEVHLASQRGGYVDAVYAGEGDEVQVNQLLIEVSPLTGTRERIAAPINGTILERLIEPGEIASPSATLMTVANLDALTLTVYVPEDRYGRIFLGENYPVTVDSFPELEFSGTVSHIADEAEFTPRNVQTTDSRKTTVFAIKLDLAPSDGRLKPGMPADVHFNFGQ